MANASVEKLKTLGLRHGEKAVVGLAAVLCVLFLFLAVNRETIDISPEQVKKSADAAASNINRPQETSEILKRLEDQFLKKPDFEESVQKQEKTVLVASDYKLRKPFVTFEPGGGLLRDKPELIAVSELYAYPGRGGILMYKLDADGNREVDNGEPVVDEGTKFREKKRRPAGGMMGGMMGGAPKKKKVVRERPKTKEELLKEALEKKKQLEKMVAGGAKGAPQEEAKEDDGGKENYKETTVGKRWVVLTGTIDHKQLQENFLTALKRPEIAQPHYKRLDVERQVLQPDGSWSEWALVDENLDILENLPEEEEEWTPESVRIRELVDPLPFLKTGSWEHVHIGSLVPKEKLDVPMPVAPEGMAQPGSSPGMSSGGMMPSMSKPLPPPTSTGSGMMMPGGMMPGGMMPGGNQMSGASETTDFTTTEADTIMLRSLDFTVEPDMSYRYRVRIVLFNPNFEREDVNPGVDTKAKVLLGPWSKPTDDVTMPADVTAYALENSPTDKNGQVQFQVTRWDPADGVTVVKNFDAGPGDVVGESRLADIPSAEGKGVKQRKVDFLSHQLVLDVAGGKKPLPPLGINGAKFENPPLSLMVRTDGAVVLRSAALDSKDEVRINIDSNYKKEKEESSKERKSSMGSGAMSSSSMMMMPGMQGPPGGGRGRGR